MDEITWQKVSKILDTALELPPEEREAWVAEACADNQSLLTEVETLLAERDSDGLLETVTSGVRPVTKSDGDPRSGEIGPYEVRQELGRGGMGIVYRAWDPRLGRDVAVKLLPPKLMTDEKARLRLLAEARAASALDHPNICTIYDIGKALDGSLYFAMACYEGQTLTERMAGEAIPADEAVKISTAILRGLEHAHSHGVIHRDVKPSNVFLTSRGEVKMLDFGLAKRGLQGLTEPGARMGTSSYMSPEQVLGRDVDHRTDLWSFGVTLYQMLTGTMPFRGEHEPSILYAIANEDPEPITGDVPAPLMDIVHRLLEKEPDDRFQSASELLAELVIATGGAPPREPQTADAPAWQRYAGPAVALLAALAGIAWFFVIGPTRDPLPPPGEPSPLTSFAGREERPSPSSDGRQVLFSWNGPELDNYDIYSQAIGSSNPVRLTDHESWESSPIWAPGDTRIAYLREISERQAELWSAAPDGSDVERLATLGAAARSGLSWSPDGQYIAVPDRDGATPTLALVDSVSGDKTVVAEAPPGAAELRFPAFSADGQNVAYWVIHGEWLGDIHLVDLADGQSRQVLSASAHPEGLSWLPDADILLYSLSSPEAARSVWYATLAGHDYQMPFSGNPAEPSVSADGTRLVISQKVSRYDIVRARLEGADAPGRPFISSTRFDGNPQYSPDGQRILFSSSRSGAVEIWTCDADGHNAKQLTFLGVAGSPNWSPDGTHIAFDSTFEGNSEIYVVPATGGDPVRITNHPESDYVPTWSRDGDWIYFASGRSGAPQLWKAPSAGGGEATLVMEETALYGHETADGKWLYYATSRSQESEIWRRPLTGGDPEPVVRGLSSGWANWSLRDTGIYYLDEISVADGAENWGVYLRRWDATESERQAAVTNAPTWGAPGFSVSPDGQNAIVGQIAVESDLMYVDGNFH